MDFSHCCAVVGSASFDAEHFAVERAAGRFACVVAADAGFASLEHMGVTPDVALGDFDSLGHVPDAPCVESHAVMKDATDLELACEWAWRAGHASLVIYGALGGRLDQTLATFQTLIRFARRGMHVASVGEGSVVVALSSRATDRPAPTALAIAGGITGVVSVCAVGGDARGVSERGLLYKLEDATLPCDSSLGVSNELTGAPAYIEVTSGDVLVFLPALPLAALC